MVYLYYSRETCCSIFIIVLISRESWQIWFHFQDADALARKAEVARKRAEDVAAGAVQMNGRELFLHEPWVFDNSLY